MVARMVGYEEKVCHCGEESEHLSDLSYGEPMKMSLSGPLFLGRLTPSPLPVPVPVSHVAGQDVGELTNFLGVPRKAGELQETRGR